MTDLISREAAIAVLKSEFYEQCPKGSVQRILFANAIEALTNMPGAGIGLPYVKFDDDLLAALRGCKSGTITVDEKP